MTEPTSGELPICPHCGTEQDDIWDYRPKDEEVMEIHCISCEQLMRITVRITANYTCEVPHD